MSTYVVFGEAGASKKLITATMNDYLDTHMELLGEDEPFNVVLVPGKVKALGYVGGWCERAGIEPEIYEDKMEAVEAGYALASSNAVVLALVGEGDPSVDTRRAIERAIDSNMVVRDLSEAGLTYILFSGDDVEHPPLPEVAEMAEETEEVGLEELVERAAQGNEEAMEALTEACEEFGIDPDAYEYWEEVGELLAEALGEDGEEEAEEEEEPGEDGWTVEALKGLTLKEVREHAKAAGIDGWKSAPRAQITKALVAGTSDEGEEEEEEAPKKKAASKSKAKAKAAPKAEAGDVDLDALADLIVAKLAEKLSA